MKRYYLLFIFMTRLLLAFDTDSKNTNTDSILSTRNKKSGFFVGVHAGVSLYSVILYDFSGNNVALQSINTVGINSKDSMQMRANVGIKLGYYHFFNRYIGLRGYFNYDYSDYRDLFMESSIASEDISIIMDIMLSVYSTKRFTLGLYVGFGVGYNLPQFSNTKVYENIESNFDYNGFIMPISCGVYISFDTHKIELGSKIPAILGRYKSNLDFSGFALKPIIINIGYTYMF